jgi:hypothetical protein
VRPLGQSQQDMLRALREHKFWHRYAGWLWQNPSVTEGVLDSLVQRGLVTVANEPVSKRNPSMIEPVYRLADKPVDPVVQQNREAIASKALSHSILARAHREGEK